MATTDRTHPHGAGEDLRGRPVRVRWGALFGGSVIGWGLLLLLSLLGIAIGLAAIEPYSVRPIEPGVGSALWSIAALVSCSLLGAYLIVRTAGERRRREAAFHGAVSWGLSMVAGALLALPAGMFAARAAENLPRATARADASGNLRLTPRDRNLLNEATSGAARTAGRSAAAAFLSLLAALLGAGLGAAHVSGRIPARRHRAGDEGLFREGELGRTSTADGELSVRGDLPDRDRPTILPPTH